MDNINKYHFKELAADEEIICVMHRNWFYIFEQFLIIFLMFGALLASLVFLPQLLPVMKEGVFADLFVFVESSLILGLWIFGFLIWIDYYFDIWIVTTHRIVNIEQQGMFSRKVSELNYDKIQDVSAQVQGFIPTMLNFGDVQVQTAGEEENFLFRTVSDPYAVKSLIMQQIQQQATEKEEAK